MPLLFSNKNWLGYYGVYSPLGNNHHLIIGLNFIGNRSLSLSTSLDENKAENLGLSYYRVSGPNLFKNQGPLKFYCTVLPLHISEFGSRRKASQKVNYPILNLFLDFIKKLPKEDNNK